MYGLKSDWESEPTFRCFVLEDYTGATPRWCPGCGDHAVLSAVQRLARDEQLPPEKTVVVSGIGCSSRFPHYMKTYGFHGLHGRPMPVAQGVRSRRPDLHIFTVTGDGDCCAIGTGHWIHALRYNMKMVVMMLDNNIYGLTKMQTSPTTPKGQHSFTHPQGAVLDALEPIPVMLGITNASFVAQTVDWSPAHLYATLKAAHNHPGLAFVRVLQRCPHYMPAHFDGVQGNQEATLLMHHPDGIPLDSTLERMFKNRVEHDPADLDEARRLGSRQDVVPLGLFYRNRHAQRYDEMSASGLEMTPEERLDLLEAELGRHAV
jgi:2-oxoglutarate ferredoxin oxidoreductase subunit beta